METPTILHCTYEYESGQAWKLVRYRIYPIEVFILVTHKATGVDATRWLTMDAFRLDDDEGILEPQRVGRQNEVLKRRVAHVADLLEIGLSLEDLNSWRNVP